MDPWKKITGDKSSLVIVKIAATHIIEHILVEGE
jgi:hypothetical protein